MSDLTGKLIANTYKDLLQIASSASNGGLDSTLRSVQDGSGNNSSLKISETSAAFTGNVSIAGSLNIGNAFTVGSIETALISATTIRGSTVSVTNITTDTLTAETLTFQDVSVSSLRTGSLTVTNNVTATAYYGDGSNLTGIASDTRIAAVSALTVVNQTSIAANTSLIVINQTSIAANASAVVVLSATLETRIAAVSALTAVNKTSIAANASAVVALSATLETRIAAVSVLTATNKTSITANASTIVALSATLESRIAALSATVATSISNYLPLAGGTLTGNLNFGDNDKAIFGTGSDLQIFHDPSGPASYISDVGNGDLILKGSNQIRLQQADGDALATFNEDGSVQLYYNNSEKLATTSTGIDITGTLTSDDLIVDDDTATITIKSFQPRLILDDDSAVGAGSDKLIIQSASAQSEGDYEFVINNDQTSSTDQVAIKISGNGNISFYEDTGTTAKLVWSASDEDLNFADNVKATFGAGDDLEIYHDGSHSYISDQGTGNLRVLAENFQVRNPANNEAMIIAIPDSGVTLYHNNSAKLATTSTGIDVTGKITVDSLGSIGVVSTDRLYMATADGLGIQLDKDNNRIVPVGADGSTYNNNVSLGASGLEFKNLFLSGTATMDGLTVSGAVTATTNDNTAQLVLKSTDADALSGPLIELFRDSSSPANDDLTGRISFQAEDSGSNKVTYSRINSYIDDVTDVSVTGKFEIDTNQIGFFRSRLMFDETEAVINDDGIDYDFRVESATIDNALFVQGSSGNVGIGGSPSRPLHVYGPDGAGEGTPTFNANTVAVFQNNGTSTDGTILNIVAGSAGNGFIGFGDSADDIRQAIVANMSDDSLELRTGNNSTALTIDSSGNVLVGKTNTTFGIVGVENRGDGRITSTRSGNTNLLLNRLSSDGDIVQFYKDGAIVGNIFSSGGIQMGIGDGDTGLLFGDNIDAIMPWSTSNSQRDAATDLGRGTTRFKDLYLSGGVYIGGTGAANLLDDYEEGTYTVQLFDASSGGNASSSSVTGRYTKIGNQVTVRFDSLNNISTAGMTGTGSLHFSLPFSASSTGRSAGSVIFDNLTFITGRTMVTSMVVDSASRGQFRTTGSAVTDQITQVQDINSGTTDIMTCTLTYFTA